MMKNILRLLSMILDFSNFQVLKVFQHLLGDTIIKNMKYNFDFISKSYSS